MSATKAEYVALSMRLSGVIPLIGLIKEVKAKGFPIPGNPSKVHCKVFKDNSGDLEMACLPKICPRPTHINQLFHFFREAVECKEVILESTPIENQITDMLTKPLSEESFNRH